jgi:hypothetical protein
MLGHATTFTRHDDLTTARTTPARPTRRSRATSPRASILRNVHRNSLCPAMSMETFPPSNWTLNFGPATP